MSVEILRLQVNTAGAWKTVIPFSRFDLARVQQAAQALYEAAPGSNWRITVGTGSSPDVIGYLGKGEQGQWRMKGDWA